MKLTFPKVKKGGPGSGDFGHRGRPGQIGGSSSGDNTMIGDFVADKKYYFVNENRPSFTFTGVSTKGTYYIKYEDGGSGMLLKSDMKRHVIAPYDYDNADKLKLLQPSDTEYDYSSVSVVDRYDDIKSDSGGGKGYFVTPDGRIIDVSDVDTEMHISYIAEHNEAFGVQDSDINYYRKYEEGGKIFSRLYSNKFIRVREYKGEVNIETKNVDKRTLSKLQKLYDTNKLGGFSTNKKHYWSSGDGSKNVSFTFADFLDAKNVFNNSLY